jgi:hypothetical protein
MKKHTSVVTTGSPEKPGLPCAMVLTASFVLSPAIGLSCHRRKRNAQALSPLDAGVEASGPHDFAVRKSAVRPRKDCARRFYVHRIPCPTFVTIAIRPSRRARDGARYEVIWVRRERKYFWKQDWTGSIRLIGFDNLGGAKKRWITLR